MIGIHTSLSASAAPGVHEKVLELLRNRERGNILDAPAGEGALSLSLKRMGFETWALDIHAERFKAPLEAQFKRADLNNDIPFSDAFFDYIVCVEGVEHLENPHHLIREFFRALKPGGELILTMPNIQNLSSRIKFLLFGSFRYFNSKIDIEDASLKGHIRPLGFPEIEMILKRNGFSLMSVVTNRSLKNMAGSIFSHFLRSMNKRFNRASNETLQTDTLLFGDILILCARRGA